MASSERRFVLPTNIAEAEPNLFPALLDRSYVEAHHLRLEAQGKPAEVPGRPLGDHLWLSLAYDFAEASKPLSSANLQSWGIAFEPALERARSNLSARTKQPLEESAPGLYTSKSLDGYDAARLVLTDTLRSLRVRGEPVAMAVARDVLLVTGSEDTDGLGAMARVAAGAEQMPDPLPSSVLRLQGEQWQPWMPNLPAVAKDFGVLLARSSSGIYARVRPALMELLDARDEDLFVANYQATVDPQGHASSFCSWGDGISSLLPRTERIAFVAESTDGRPRMLADVPWRKAQGVVGHLMQPTRYYPGYVRVELFPSDEELAELRA
jgi:hypothetical protein